MPNLFVEGLTVDGSDWSSGFSAKDGANRVTYRDCVAKNCLNTGFNAFYCDEISYINCKAIGVKYAASGLITADGFYVGACNDTSYINCIADNFQRIGFVSEGESAADSNRTRYVSCLAKNGNNCDRSPEQYNTGFWMENTNGAVIDDCTVLDIAGNVGQTSGRVGGIVLTAIGDAIDHLTVLSNTTVGDSSGTLPFGVQVGGTSGFAKVVIKNVRIKNYRTGVEVLGGIDSVTIEDLLLREGQYDASGRGGVVCNLLGSLNQISLTRVREVNASYGNNNAATFNVFSFAGGGDRIVNLNQCHKISLRMVGSVSRITINDSHIQARTSSFDVVCARVALCSNSVFEYVSGNGKLFLGGEGATTDEAYFTNCRIQGFGSSMQNYAGGIASFSNCFISETRIPWTIDNDNAILKFVGCTWKNTTELPCIYGNYFNRAKDQLFVQNCSFYTANATAIVQWNYSPDYVVLQGNTYNCTNLTNMTATSSVNNVATP
jgi:hypothetical protein